MICKILTIQDIDTLPQFVKDHNINLVIRQGFRYIGNRESYIGMGYICYNHLRSISKETTL